ncbi:uncharacterized protein LOC115595708 [Sparus aurata]|uniref:uncharacterized protein LOC115595708 n=1 Tax=Sparus aurata TaxID=8175 RepID=UPI0011C13B33|nr:uncharacterized protein LOC115595708 [Sparus aurata]
MASPVDVNAVDKVLEEMLKAEADNARSPGSSIEWTLRVQMLQAWKHDIAENHYACVLHQKSVTMASPVDVNAVDKVLEEMLKVEADNAQRPGSIKWASRIQMLLGWKHDIAEKHHGIGRFLDHILTDSESDAELLDCYHAKENPVKLMYKVIDRCLESEESAMKFLWVFFQMQTLLYLDLLKDGPRGKFVRRDPPVVELTEKVRSALGDKVEHLKNVTATPLYKNRILNVKCALDVLMTHNQLLPEEYAEFGVNKRSTTAMIRLLQKLCSDTAIPQANREFISLVVASFNLHVFDLPTMPLNDVLVFVK